MSESECLAIEGGAAWDRGEGMIKGCTKDNSGSIDFNTNTHPDNNVACGNNGVCIQIQRKFIKVEAFAEVSSGAPDLSLSVEECQEYDGRRCRGL